MLRWTTMPSPIGTLMLMGTHDHLTGLYMERHDPAPSAAVQSGVRDDRPFEEARRQLGEYFAGTRRTFELPILAEGTEFQQRVWSALLEIPYGTTISYLDLARRVGDEKAVRAVGLANGLNPISIIIPCHRVIGSDGSLTGYGGGIERKRWLLQHEASHTPMPLEQ
ncbi:MAG TPA: methylated-DNA--[protein]-cysteine S-methyltransferase [Gemmatimonadales bacterium]|nr:methylated-DNA--[protein]-cysteine S-methyltransferase [Gemmatimonadales bacterium]